MTVRLARAIEEGRRSSLWKKICACRGREGERERGREMVASRVGVFWGVGGGLFSWFGKRMWRNVLFWRY